MPPLPSEVRSNHTAPPPRLRIRTQLVHKVTAPLLRARERAHLVRCRPAPRAGAAVGASSSRRCVGGRGPLLGGEGGERRGGRRSVHPPSGAPLATELLRSFPALPAYARAPAARSCPLRDENPPPPPAFSMLLEAVSVQTREGRRRKTGFKETFTPHLLIRGRYPGEF